MFSRQVHGRCTQDAALDAASVREALIESFAAGRTAEFVASTAEPVSRWARRRDVVRHEFHAERGVSGLTLDNRGFAIVAGDASLPERQRVFDELRRLAPRAR
jgi:hypothetical protein